MRAALAALLLTAALTIHACMPPFVEQIIVPLGLLTEPNKLGQYPAGALSQASGLVMRSPGLLSRLPTQAVYAGIGTADIRALMSPSDSKLWSLFRFSGAWNQDWFSAGVFLNNNLSGFVPYGPLTFATDGRVTATRSRDRFLFNSDQGILINDNANPTTNAEAKPRMAGLPAPLVTAGVLTTTTYGALTANSHCSCQAIIRRKFADGYEIVSAPSPACEVLSITVDHDISFTVTWQAGAQVVAGDVIEVYRTRSQATSPTIVSVGATYYLSTTHTITSGEVAPATTTFSDFTRDNSLGAELYTNPGQGGANTARLPPPNARCIATFKGYTFYGNRTDAAQIVTSVPGGIGLLVPATQRVGVGRHTFTATFTNTSNTLTAISAADIVGLAVGQVMTDASLTGGVGTITAVGATTVTLSTTANATVTKSTSVNDVIELSGTVFQLGSWGADVGFSNILSFIKSLQASSAYDFALFASDLFADAYGSITSAPKSFAVARPRVGGGSFTIRASNGQNYVPALPDMTQTAQTVTTTAVPNGIAWSEEQQPEAVPPLNTASVGSGTIYGMFPTRDALWIFTSDGLWRLSGTGGGAGRGFDWRRDQVDSTLSLSAPHAACVLRDTVYAYTNRGLVAINGSGINDRLSQGRIGDLLPGPPFTATATIQMAADETNDEVHLLINVSGTNGVVYVYNTVQDAWTTYDPAVSTTKNGLVIAYARYLQCIVTADTSNSMKPSTTNFAEAVLAYQPISTGDPFAVKQWIDATLVGTPASASSVFVPSFNGIEYTGRTLLSQVNDARASVSVPRNAPAVANTLAPGFRVVANTLAFGLYGIALRSNPLTNQRLKR